MRADQVEALARAATDRARRRLIEQLNAQGFSAQQGPDPECLTIADAAGSQTVIRFSGRDARLTSPIGRVFNFTFDEKNRVQSLTDPGGLQVRFAYDTAGRLETVDRAARGQHSIYRFDHDPFGGASALHYPDGKALRFRNDAWGRVVEVEGRDGRVRRFDYNEFGLPARVTLGPDRETTYFCNERGELETVEHPGGKRTEYVEQPRTGSVEVRQNGDTVVRCTAEADSVLLEYPDSTWLRVKQADGRLISAATAVATLEFGYDALGLVEQESFNGEAVSYERNAVGAIKAIVSPGGDRILYKRDDEHRVKTITDWDGLEYQVGYEDSGAVSSITYPNGVVVTRANNPLGLVETLTLKGHSGATLRTSFSYDECDRVKSETMPDGCQRRFAYDAEARLFDVGSDRADLRESFSLDPYGNCHDANGINASFAPSDEILSRDGKAVKHDAHGRVKRCDLPCGPAELDYDAQGRLVEITTEHSRSRYEYDPIGRRISKHVLTIEGATLARTHYTWAGTLLLSETTYRPGKPKEVHRYLPVPDLGIHLAQTIDGTPYFLHYGRRNETVAMTDRAGRLVWQAEYSAFGKARIIVDQVGQPFRLVGQQYDDETGLHYNLARYYHPDWGRYLQRDPLGFEGGSWNEYIYGDGDPLNRADPTGEFLPIILAGMAIGAGIGAGVEMYRQRKANPNAPFDWGKIGKEALIGGAIGGIGAVVGIAMAPIAAALGAGLGAVMAGGALIGGVTAAIEACAEAEIRGRPISLHDLVATTVIGAGIGAVTAGVGGVLANRARRLDALRQTEQGLAAQAEDAVIGATGKRTDAAIDAARVSSKPEWLRRLDQGKAFNAQRSAAYDYNEVYINSPKGSGYTRLDSYNPATGEIVSRKFTQLSEIQEKTALHYINELPAKYPVNATIANVPSSGSLAGQPLLGQYYLEVPVQVRPISKSILDAADRAGVVIRDVNGKIYQ